MGMPSPGIFSLIYNFLVPLPWIFFFRRTLTPRAGLRGKGLTSYILLLFMLLIALIFYQHLLLKLFLSMVLLLLYTELCYSDHFGRRVFILLAHFLLLFLGELSSAALILLLTKDKITSIQDNPPMMIITTFFSFFLSSYLFGLGARLLTRTDDKISRVEFLKYSILPLSQLVVLLFFTDTLIFSMPNHITLGSALLVALAVLTSILADLLMLRTIQTATKSVAMKLQNQHLAEENRLQLEHYAALTQQQQEIRKMRHDISNQIQSMNTLLAQDQRALAQECNNRLLENLSAYGTVDYCAHPVVDAVLHNKLEQARALGIQVSVSVCAEPTLPFEHVDLMCIFSNLLDNAIHACADLPEPSRFLQLTAATRCGCYLIELRNAKSPQSKPAPKPLENHGQGLMILSDLARKYQGHFTKEDLGASFRAVLSLPLPQPEQGV